MDNCGARYYFIKTIFYYTCNHISQILLNVSTLTYNVQLKILLEKLLILAVVCKLVSILATIIGYMTYRPNDLDNALSIQTTDSRGPLSLTVNDDRHIHTLSQMKGKNESVDSTLNDNRNHFSKNNIAFNDNQVNVIKTEIYVDGSDYKNNHNKKTNVNNINGSYQ